MALIKLTAIVDQISGKLNGTVFARNKGGAYMRSKSKPSNPQTTAQMGVRAAFGAIASAWRGLPQNARNAWNEATANFPYQNKLGDSRILSGFALHQKLNRNLQLIGLPMISTPPLPSPTATVVDVNVSVTNAEFLVTPTFDGAENDADVVAIFATPSLSPGIQNFKKELRLVDTISIGDFNEGRPDVLDTYSAKFGVPVTGAKIGMKFVVINSVSGQDSAPFYHSQIVG